MQEWTMKRKKNKKPRRKSRRNSVSRPIPRKTATFKKPRTARQYFAMSLREQEIWDSLGSCNFPSERWSTASKGVKGVQPCSEHGCRAWPSGTAKEEWKVCSD